MGLVLFFAFLVVPIAELAVIVGMAREIGILWTLALLFGISVTGSVLAKRQGLEVWRRVRETLARGQMPSTEVVDGFLVLLGGALLLSPGFLTDIAGVVLLFPPTRAVVRRYLARRFRTYVDRAVWGDGGTRRARVVRIRTGRGPSEPDA